MVFPQPCPDIPRSGVFLTRIYPVCSFSLPPCNKLEIYLPMLLPFFMGCALFVSWMTSVVLPPVVHGQCLVMASFISLVTSVASSASTGFLSGCQRSCSCLMRLRRSSSSHVAASCTALVMLALMLSRLKTPVKVAATAVGLHSFKMHHTMTSPYSRDNQQASQFDTWQGPYLGEARAWGIP